VRSLELNQTVRLTHDCSVSGKSKNLSVTRNKNGYVYHCFKCGSSGSLRTSVTPVRPRPRVNRVYKIPAAATGEVSRWRRPVAEWIKKYLTDTEVLDHGLVSHEYDLYVPISAGNFLIRSFDPSWDGPKWIKRGDARHYRVGNVNCNTVVITEDCISACVVGSMTESIALLGTSIHNDTLELIARQRYSEAVVWLDDDNTIVRKAQNKIRDRLSLVVPTVRVVRCGTDPKNIPRKELGLYIW
jgi:hypothetical protein